MLFKKIDPRALTPHYQSAGAACFDLHALVDEPVALYPGLVEVVSTGLAFQVPLGKAMEVYVRSSLGFKWGVTLANGVGIIDADYRGEVKIALMNNGPDMMLIRPGDRIAQAKLVDAEQIELREADYLTETARGTGGFGSTGR